jgi:hypothetical protein
MNVLAAPQDHFSEWGLGKSLVPSIEYVSQKCSAIFRPWDFYEISKASPPAGSDLIVSIFNKYH